MNLFSSVLGVFFPRTLSELKVFLFACLVYIPLGVYIAWEYRLVFDDRIPWDAYWSFDNRAIILTGGGAERHPFSYWLFHPQFSLAKWLFGSTGVAGFRMFYTLISGALVSLSVMQLWRYFTGVIQLPWWPKFLLTLLFGSSSTAVLLSFTPETYTWTMFLLLVYLNYASVRLALEKPISPLAMTVFSISIGGLTITNIAKVLMPPLFFPRIFSSFRSFLRAMISPMIALVVFASLLVWRFYPNPMFFLEKTEQQYEKFSNPKFLTVPELVYHYFFGANILMPDLVTRDYHSKSGFPYKAIFPDVFRDNTDHVVLGSIGALVIAGMVCIILRKNRIAGMVLGWFAIDFIIHAVLKFGLHSSFVYGGHFVFVFPVMMGWLLYYAHKKPLWYQGILVLLGGISLYVGINAVSGLFDLFQLANVHYLASAQ